MSKVYVIYSVRVFWGGGGIWAPFHEILGATLEPCLHIRLFMKSWKQHWNHVYTSVLMILTVVEEKQFNLQSVIMTLGLSL